MTREPPNAVGLLPMGNVILSMTREPPNAVGLLPMGNAATHGECHFSLTSAGRSGDTRNYICQYAYTFLSYWPNISISTGFI